MNDHVPHDVAPPSIVDHATALKAEAIVKDAGQFWLALLMCIFCTALGALIVPIWYGVRLAQWHGLAKANPILVGDGPPMSLQLRFQRARTFLLIGVIGGCCLLGVQLLAVAVILSS